MTILIKVPVYPTESREMVMEAVEHIFPGASLHEKIGANNPVWFEGSAPDLARFTELLAVQKIRDAARTFLMNRVAGNRISFSLNKQAALAGRINFIEDGRPPLGSIDVTIEHERLEQMIERITHIPIGVIGGGSA